MNQFESASGRAVAHSARAASSSGAGSKWAAAGDRALELAEADRAGLSRRGRAGRVPGICRHARKDGRTRRTSRSGSPPSWSVARRSVKGGDRGNDEARRRSRCRRPRRGWRGGRLGQADRPRLRAQALGPRQASRHREHLVLAGRERLPLQWRRRRRGRWWRRFGGSLGTRSGVVGQSPTPFSGHSCDRPAGSVRSSRAASSPIAGPFPYFRDHKAYLKHATACRHPGPREHLLQPQRDPLANTSSCRRRGDRPDPERRSMQDRRGTGESVLFSCVRDACRSRSRVSARKDPTRARLTGRSIFYITAPARRRHSNLRRRTLARNKVEPMLASVKTTSEILTAKFAVDEALDRLERVYGFLKPLSASDLPEPVETALSLQKYMVMSKLTGAKKAIDRALSEVEPMTEGSDR